jgi:molybdate transport system ATP-binding protein
MNARADAATVARLRVNARKRLEQFQFACDLDLPLSGLTALFGRSGAGKSTLMNLIAGLHRPDDGRISIGDEVFFDRAAGIDRPVHQRALGVVFQDARLFPHLTVRHNLAFGLKRAGERAKAPRIGFDAVVDLLGIAPLLARRPHSLSGGEKQRVAIGRALLAQPRLLLMDEPLASLDAARKAEVLPYIERLRDEVGVPIVYVSHAIDEVLRLATALVLIDHGQVLAAGPLAEVLQQREARPLLGEAQLGTLVFGHRARARRRLRHDHDRRATASNCVFRACRCPPAVRCARGCRRARWRWHWRDQPT